MSYEQSCRHGGAFGGLAPQTKLQAPPNWNIKHYKSVEFLSIFSVKPPRRKAKPPIENFLATVLVVRGCFLEITT